MSRRHDIQDASGRIVYYAGVGTLSAWGTSVPADATAGFAPGCIFHHVDGSAGAVLYVNNGTFASCLFDAIAATGGDFTLEDNKLLRLGTDGDQVLVNRSTLLAADTALTNVIVGTPVVAAIPANSLIISNVTADGDLVFIGQTGGNSTEWMRYDASATAVIFNEDSADIDFRFESNVLSNFFVMDGNACLNGQFAFGGAIPTNPQAFFSILPAVNASGVTANQSYFHFQMLPGAAVTVPAGTAPVVASMNIHEPNITATGTVTAAATVRIVDAPTEGTTNWALWVDAGLTRFDENVFIGDTSDANITGPGLCINQAASDDVILSLKSSDVAHGVTTLIETDTYGFARKVAGADGGLALFGVSDVTIALVLHGVSVTEDTTDAPTTASLNTANIRGGIKSGTTTTTVGATGNLFGVQNNDGTNEFVVKGDGELYSNQSATVGTFDEHDDAVMCRDLSHALSHEYDKIVGYNRQTFEQLGILGPLDDKGQGMYSVTKMLMLSICAIGQLGKQINTLAEHLSVKLDKNGGLLAAE